MELDSTNHRDGIVMILVINIALKKQIFSGINYFPKKVGWFVKLLLPFVEAVLATTILRAKMAYR